MYFLHFHIFCPSLWQITTLSAKDHQPNKGGFLILMFHEEEEGTKRKVRVPNWFLLNTINCC